MIPIIDGSLELVVDESRRVVLVLYKPATPQIIDTFLISGATDHCDSMEVDLQIFRDGQRILQTRKLWFRDLTAFSIAFDAFVGSPSTTIL